MAKPRFTLQKTLPVNIKSQFHINYFSKMFNRCSIISNSNSITVFLFLEGSRDGRGEFYTHSMSNSVTTDPLKKKVTTDNMKS